MKYFFWDIDGTLLDTSRGVKNAFIYAMGTAGYDLPSDELMTEAIGPQMEDGFAQIFKVKSSDVDKCVGLFCKYYSEKGFRESEPFPGTMEALKLVHELGDKNIMASMKLDEHCEQCLKYFGFWKYVDNMFAANVSRGLVDKDSELSMALREIGMSPADCVMTGDRRSDIEAGIKNGMRTVAAEFGFGPDDEFDGIPVDRHVVRSTDLTGMVREFSLRGF